MSLPNIRTMLKNANQVLFTDDEHFNKDVTGAKNLADIKSWLGIRGNLKKVGFYSNKVVYRLSDSYNFTLTFL